MLLSYVWGFSGHGACEVLAPQPGIGPAPPALKGEVLTPGSPAMSLFFISLTVWFILGSCNQSQGSALSLSQIITFPPRHNHQHYSFLCTWDTCTPYTCTCLLDRGREEICNHSFIHSLNITEHMDCTSIVVGADDILMNETDKTPIFREQMAPATNIADCPGLTICFHLSTLEAGPIIPNPPLSLSRGTHSSALESFTDIFSSS